MMSPLKLSVIVCGAAAGLAVAPYVVKQILPPATDGLAAVEVAPASVESATTTKLDLPIAGQNSAPVTAPALALAAPQKEEPPAGPELRLAAPELPAPAATQPELTLPSLANTSVASAMPAPSITPAPTPRPTPAPTPEIPYRADVETAQNLMKKLGIDTGKIDGKLGPNTQAAVRDFQKKEGLNPTGDVNADLLARMEKSVAALPTPTPEPKVVISDASAESDSAAVEDADRPEAVIVRKGDDKEAKDKADKKPQLTAAPAMPKVDPGPVPTLKNMKDVRKLQAQLKEAGTYTGDVDGKWGDLTRAAMREFQENVGIEVTGKPNKETWLAMHSDAPAEAATESDTDTAAELDDMKISTADADVPSLSADENGEYVVTLNGDGTSKPGSKAPLPTPSTVSSLDEEEESDSSLEEESSTETASKPKVKVQAPDRDEPETESESDEPADLAVAEVDEEAEAEKLRKEIESTRARIESVSSDSEYEVKKYAPKMLETVNTMADSLKMESVSNNPADTKARLKRIEETLEKAKDESRHKKAEALVKGVRTSYKNLKNHFTDRIKALSLKDPDQKSQREELTVLVADVDLGFETMEKDFKARKFDPIFENANAFQLTIDQINDKLAQLYVDASLEDDTVKDKLKKDDLKDIESYMEKNDHLKAAELLEKHTSTSSKKKSS